MIAISHLCEDKSSLNSRSSHFLENLLGLEGEHTEKDNVAFGNDSFIVVINEDPKVLLECSQQVRLSC